jgi:adenosylhomocysteine nucleosidase
MSEVAIVAALEREIAPLLKRARRVEREHDGRRCTFFENEETVIVCGGMGAEAARRAAEAVIALYHPQLVQSVGFAGALQPTLRVGDIFVPSIVIDARDGSRTETQAGTGTLLTFMSVAGVQQKASLAQSYAAQAVDMEAAFVAAAARAREVKFRAIKVISDEVDFEMPDMSRFIDARGRFKTASFVFFTALQPWLWGRVITLARNSNQAAKKLSKYLSEVHCKADATLEVRAI